MTERTRKATLQSLTPTGIAAVIAALNFFWSTHHNSPWARFQTILWLALFGISVLVGVLRISYYRSHRDYFAEEMEHRRTLAKDR